MGVEGPAISAIIARLADPEINLAAYGGIVHPLMLLIESPIIMLLSASTALSKDKATYLKLYRFMMGFSAILTAVHFLVAVTPLFDWVAHTLLDSPPEIIDPARIGMLIMTPWTWSIAYRRFHQGVLIRFGHPRVVSVGTMVRLGTLVVLLLAGYAIGGMAGIVVGTIAEACAVVAESAFIGWRVRPVLRQQVFLQPEAEPLQWPVFIRFYVPLMMTSFLTLVWNPMGSAAMGRMMDPISSLAAWPVVFGLIFIFRSVGNVLNEVVISLIDQHGSSRALRDFSLYLALGVLLSHLAIAVTPLSEVYFRVISALKPELADLAQLSFLIAAPMPAMNVLINYFQGAIVTGKRTQGVTESVAVFLVTAGVVLGYGIWRGDITGLYVGMVAFTLGSLTQMLWLWFRSRPVLEQVRSRDQASLELPA